MDNDKKDLWPDEDHVIYVPDELYHSFHAALNKMDEAQEELRKIRAELEEKKQNNAQV
jgi:hypothetical protein